MITSKVTEYIFNHKVAIKRIVPLSSKDDNTKDRILPGVFNQLSQYLLENYGEIDIHESKKDIEFKKELYVFSAEEMSELLNLIRSCHE